MTGCSGPMASMSAGDSRPESIAMTSPGLAGAWLAEDRLTVNAAQARRADPRVAAVRPPTRAIWPAWRFAACDVRRFLGPQFHGSFIMEEGILHPPCIGCYVESFYLMSKASILCRKLRYVRRDAGWRLRSVSSYELVISLLRTPGRVQRLSGLLSESRSMPSILGCIYWRR